MTDLVTELLKIAAKKKKKPKGTATKRDPKKWAAAKARAKAKMGGKWSARAAQLAVKYYKDSGGKYKGKKPTAKNNKLKKWTKQDWQWSGERKKKSSINDELVASLLEFSKEAGKKKKKKGKGVYLPAKSIDALKSSKKGRKKLRAASRKKSKATREGKQHADHGLHKGKKRSKLGASDPNYRDRVALWLHDGKGNLLVQDDREKGLGLKFPGGGIDPGQSVNEAAMREALEEVGYSLADKPRSIPGIRAKKIDWDPVFSEEAAAKGRNYKGSKHYHRLALAGKPDESLLGSEGDALSANWMPIAEVVEATRDAAANPTNKYNYFDEERLRVAERIMAMLEDKTASFDTDGNTNKINPLEGVYNTSLLKTSQTKESRAFLRNMYSALSKTHTGQGLNYVAKHPTTSKVVKGVGAGARKATEVIRGAPATARSAYYDPRLSRFSMRVQGVQNNPVGEQVTGSVIEPVQLAGDILSKIGSYPNSTSPYRRAYQIGCKLAQADFTDNDNVEDGLSTHDNEVYHKVKAEDFISPEDHGNKTPSTNNYSYGQTKNDEVVPEDDEGSIYQATKIERRERHG